MGRRQFRFLNDHWPLIQKKSRQMDGVIRPWTLTWAQGQGQGQGQIRCGVSHFLYTKWDTLLDRWRKHKDNIRLSNILERYDTNGVTRNAEGFRHKTPELFIPTSCTEKKRIQSLMYPWHSNDTSLVNPHVHARWIPCMKMGKRLLSLVPKMEGKERMNMHTTVQFAPTLYCEQKKGEDERGWINLPSRQKTTTTTTTTTTTNYFRSLPLPLFRHFDM